MEIKEWQARLVLIIFTGILIFFRFPDFFQSPNTMVIEPYGDGHKAYTTIQYHAKYDSTYSHFEGMNYPYGEHVVPAATQPLLSNSIKFFSRNFYDITDYTIGIVNFSLLLSILLSVFFLYLIFRQLELPWWYSLIVAIGLSFLAPQLVRFKSHYGLAHMETLPILLYLMMRFDVRRSIGRSLWIALAVFLLAQIHFYFFAIMVFTISFYFLFDFTRKWAWKKLHKYAFHYGLQVGLPLVFFFFWMYYGDPVQDRTAAPWGFFEYRAYWEGIFTSLAEPHFRWVHNNLVNIRLIDMEGQAYVGLIATTFFIILLVQWIAGRFQKPYLHLESIYSPFLNRVFYAGLCILLFSLGLPFTISGLDALLEYTGPIRQFRSIGRFAWVFYYVMNVIAFFWLYKKANEHSAKPMRIALLALGLSVLVFEAYHFAWSKDLKLDKIEEMQPGERYTDGLQIDFPKYQAILTVPHYNIGSDNFWWHLGGFIAQKSLTLSSQTGLPVTSALLTRTSLSHTINQLQLVTEPYRLPKILEDFPNEKPLLMAWDERSFQEEKDKYAHLLEGALLLHEKEALRLYELPLETFQKRIDDRKTRWLNEQQQADTLYAINNFLTTQDKSNFIYLPFDDQHSENKYFGKGAYKGLIREQNILFDGVLPNCDTSATYILSFWMFIQEDLRPRSILEWVASDPATGQVVDQHKIPVRTLVKAFDNNGWALLETYFKPRSGKHQFKASIYNEQLKEQDLYVDELLIRPVSQQLYRNGADYIWKNNRWFPN